MNAVAEKSVRLSTELREALEEIKKTSTREEKSDGFYRLDRRDAYEYFGVLPKWRKKVSQYLQELREQEENIVYVDICGRAKAASLGANENYSFSLQPIRFSMHPPDSNREDPRFRGDIFSTRDFNAFLRMIRRNGDQPAFITFEPVAGLQGYIPHKGSAGRPRLNEEVTFQILERHLRRIVSILRPGGYIFLGPPFQFSNDLGDFFSRLPQDQYKSSVRIKALAKELKCSIEVGATINGPRWLLNKRFPRGGKTNTTQR